MKHQGSQADIRVLRIGDFSGENDTELLLNAFAAAEKLSQETKSGSITLLLEKREYRIHKTLPLHSVHNLQIDGQGATFIWTELVHCIEIENSCRCGFKNITLDFDPLPFTQGVVQEVGEGEVTTLIVEIDQGYSIDVDRLNDKTHRNGMIWTDVHNRSNEYSVNGAVMEDMHHTYWFKDAKNIGGNRIQLTGNPHNGTDYQIKPGQVVCLFPFGPNTFNINQCDHISFENITVFSSGVSAFRIGGGIGGHRFTNCRVVPGPKPIGATEERLRSVNGDVIHATSINEGPVLEGCTFTHSGDDCINVTGFFYHIIKKAGRTVTLTGKWGVTLMENLELILYDKDDYYEKGRAVIKSIKKVKDDSLADAVADCYSRCYNPKMYIPDLYEVELDRELDITVGDHVNAPDKSGSGMTIRNCCFGFNRARGILVRGHRVLIENNTFSYITCPALKIQPELTWCEGGFAGDVTIRGNVFRHTSISYPDIFDGGTHMGSVTLSVEPLLGSKPGFLDCYELKNIVIEDNVFESVRNYAVSAINCDGITIRNNQIHNPFRSGVGTVGQHYGITPHSAILVAKSRNIIVTGNTLSTENEEITQVVEIHDSCTQAVENKNTILFEQ